MAEKKVKNREKIKMEDVAPPPWPSTRTLGSLVESCEVISDVIGQEDDLRAAPPRRRNHPAAIYV